MSSVSLTNSATLAPLNPILLQIMTNEFGAGPGVSCPVTVDFGYLRGGELLIDVEALQVLFDGRPGGRGLGGLLLCRQLVRDFRAPIIRPLQNEIRLRPR
jgi:hypothetical protein